MINIFDSIANGEEPTEVQAQFFSEKTKNMSAEDKADYLFFLRVRTIIKTALRKEGDSSPTEEDLEQFFKDTICKSVDPALVAAREDIRKLFEPKDQPRNTPF